MTSRAEQKRRVRKRVWDRLAREGIARFPFPPHGRIPNFEGAREAAERLFEHPLLRRARCIKVTPDAPQRPVRLLAGERGINVYMPTPRLRAGFLRLDPDRIPASRRADAASLSRGRRYATEVPTPDVLVAGSVAVTRRGARCGKGEGYADLEYGILRALGHPDRSGTGRRALRAGCARRRRRRRPARRPVCSSCRRSRWRSGARADAAPCPPDTRRSHPPRRPLPG